METPTTQEIKETQETEFFMGIDAPWAEKIQQGGDPCKYWKMHTNALIAAWIFGYTVAIITVLALSRYRIDEYFWSVILTGVVWIGLGGLSLWYIWLHGSVTASIIVAVLFTLIYIGFLYYMLETRHQKYKHIENWLQRTDQPVYSQSRSSVNTSVNTGGITSDAIEIF